MDQLKDCVICMDPLGDDYCVVRCDHRFHKSCLDTWCRVKMSCPLCRTDLRDEDDEDLDQMLFDVTTEVIDELSSVLVEYTEDEQKGMFQSYYPDDVDYFRRDDIEYNSVMHTGPSVKIMLSYTYCGESEELVQSTMSNLDFVKVHECSCGNSTKFLKECVVGNEKGYIMLEACMQFHFARESSYCC